MDIRPDSRCPTPCKGCNTLHYRTPCAQLGRVSRCFPFVTSQIFLRMSDSVQGPQRFCIIGQLVPNSAEWSDVFPFYYDSNISLIYCRRPVGLRMSESAQWPRRFCIIGQLTPNSAECSDVFPFITFHFSFFQIYFHCYLAYLISDISRGTCI